MEQPHDTHTLPELLAESKRLSELSDQIRKQMDAVTEEIARRAAAKGKSDPSLKTLADGTKT